MAEAESRPCTPLPFVDIGAPGSGIYSTTPQNGYGSLNGTSMATPHVTGAAAVYKPATATEIRASM